MSVDTIGNFLTMIRNALTMRKRTVTAPYSKMREQITRVLLEECYVRDYAKKGEGVEASITLILKYVDGESVIHQISRVSKPGRRHYEKIADLRQVIGGLGIAILSTNAGIIADRAARERNVGGEVLCHVW